MKRYCSIDIIWSDDSNFKTYFYIGIEYWSSPAWWAEVIRFRSDNEIKFYGRGSSMEKRAREIISLCTLRTTQEQNFSAAGEA